MNYNSFIDNSYSIKVKSNYKCNESTISLNDNSQVPATINSVMNIAIPDCLQYVTLFCRVCLLFS